MGWGVINETDFCLLGVHMSNVLLLCFQEKSLAFRFGYIHCEQSLCSALCWILREAGYSDEQIHWDKAMVVGVLGNDT